MKSTTKATKTENRLSVERNAAEELVNKPKPVELPFQATVRASTWILQQKITYSQTRRYITSIDLLRKMGTDALRDILEMSPRRWAKLLCKTIPSLSRQSVSFEIEGRTLISIKEDARSACIISGKGRISVIVLS